MEGGARPGGEVGGVRRDPQNHRERAYWRGRWAGVSPTDRYVAAGAPISRAEVGFCAGQASIPRGGREGGWEGRASQHPHALFPDPRGPLAAPAPRRPGLVQRARVGPERSGEARTARGGARGGRGRAARGAGQTPCPSASESASRAALQALRSSVVRPSVRRSLVRALAAPRPLRAPPRPPRRPPPSAAAHLVASATFLTKSEVLGGLV